ncbi:hypothetical protein LCGC14_1768600 [marine sediment metagenome]|uniref:Phage head-tail adaptor n=1 Tax=marine sediment metagenome TaxID=412755 RepID=A0A0F9HLG0_9ZZZZ
MSFDALLIHICNIGALTQGVGDAYGLPAETFPASYTDQECRIMANAGKEVKVGAEVYISDWTLFLPDDITVDEQDRISNIRLRSDSTVIDAGTYEVIKVIPRSDGVDEHHKELALRKVD